MSDPTEKSGSSGQNVPGTTAATQRVELGVGVSIACHPMNAAIHEGAKAVVGAWREDGAGISVKAAPAGDSSTNTAAQAAPRMQESGTPAPRPTPSGGKNGG